MVDFNNETTVGIAPAKIVKILILQARANLLDAWEDYKVKKYMNAGVSLNVVKARLFTMFLELQPSILRKPKGKIKVMQYLTTLDSWKEEEILKMIMELNEYMDQINLLRIDTKKFYDTSNVEEEDKERNL